MAAAAKILDNVIDHNGMKVNLERKFTGKVLGLYFSAHWCPQSLYHKIRFNIHEKVLIF